MPHTSEFDRLAVVNGPEDGSEFALMRLPFTVGTDPNCTAHLRLDNTVQAVHAQGTAAPDGFRIRSSVGAPVFVDGKRVGMVKSRVLRPGGVLKVGHTELMLHCSSGGLANRSRGIVTESDFAWALRAAGRGLVAVVSGAYRWGTLGPRLLRRHWKGLAVVAALVGYFIYPPFNQFVDRLIHTVIQTIR